MPDLTIRTFDVVYEGPSISSADSTGRFAKTVYAAYFQQGLGVGEDSDAFVVFKDCQHKPVFTVRASSVVSIEEIRADQPQFQTISVSGSSPMSDVKIAEFCDSMTRRFRQQFGYGGDTSVAPA